jgi:uncharacterized protein
MPFLTRAVYIVVGLSSLGLAVLGALLPGMPTTVFLLISLWAFSRSSERLHAWVKRMPIFRDALIHVERYHAERSISRGVKLVGRGLEPSLTALLLVVLAMSCTIFMAMTRTAARQPVRD